LLEAAQCGDDHRAVPVGDGRPTTLDRRRRAHRMAPTSSARRRFTRCGRRSPRVPRSAPPA
jgi:hypothetical protein